MASMVDDQRPFQEPIGGTHYIQGIILQVYGRGYSLNIYQHMALYGTVPQF